MCWLIMNDEIDYPCEFYPTHVITEDKDLIPVFLGASSAIAEKAIGIYVREEDYLKLNHKKAYIFVHDPDADKEDFKELDWSQIPDVSNPLAAGREHIHVWITDEQPRGEATEEDQKK